MYFMRKLLAYLGYGNSDIKSIRRNTQVQNIINWPFETCPSFSIVVIVIFRDIWLIGESLLTWQNLFKIYYVNNIEVL